MGLAITLHIIDEATRPPYAAAPCSPACRWAGYRALMWGSTRPVTDRHGGSSSRHQAADTHLRAPCHRLPTTPTTTHHKREWWWAGAGYVGAPYKIPVARSAACGATRCGMRGYMEPLLMVGIWYNNNNNNNNNNNKLWYFTKHCISEWCNLIVKPNVFLNSVDFLLL